MSELSPCCLPSRGSMALEIIVPEVQNRGGSQQDCRIESSAGAKGSQRWRRRHQTSTRRRMADGEGYVALACATVLEARVPRRRSAPRWPLPCSAAKPRDGVPEPLQSAGATAALPLDDDAEPHRTYALAGRALPAAPEVPTRAGCVAASRDPQPIAPATSVTSMSPLSSRGGGSARRGGPGGRARMPITRSRDRAIHPT